MSFILDALRKSEHERQRNRAPGIADMRAAQKQRNRGIWIPLVALLAGLNVALLAVLWFMGSDDTAPVATAPVAQRSAPAISQRGAPATRPDTTSLSDELSSPATTNNDMAEPSRFASVAIPAADTGAGTAPADTEGMLTVTEALLDGSLNIKPLHLDIHVYSDVPAERFVFINTARYGEGERIAEGPTVNTINKQGVILSYQGRNYLLTRN